MMDPRYITLEIKGSSSKMLGLGFMGIGMAALCGAVANVSYGSDVKTAFDHYGRIGIMGVGIFGVLFFGWAAWITFSQFLSAGKPLIVLNRQGILDVRLSERPIAWEAIRDVGVWEAYRQKVIVLSVPPEVEAAIGVSAMTRWARGANRSLGADGLSISATGLEMKHDNLLAAIIERVNAAQAS